MDIEKIKKYSQNKIEADDLIKQVRKQIKETTWEKQNLREGFTETFKPLISQFEDPGEDSKKQNIFTQNQKMLQNQLALTEGVRNNQLALKGIKDQQGHFNRALEYLENLADMEELPGIAAIKDEKDDQAPKPTPFKSISPTPTPPKSLSPTPTPQVEKKEENKVTIAKEFVDRNLDNKEAQDTLKKNGFEELPSYYFDKDLEEIGNRIKAVQSNLFVLSEKIKNKVYFYKNNEGYQYVVSNATKRGPTPETEEEINTYNTLSIYVKNLRELEMAVENVMTGSGLFNTPQELIRRLELLNGSLVAGNNGVLPEFIQISHRLRDLGILTNKQLNTLLRKVI